MADIKLARPAAGQNVAVPSAPEARVVLDFPADQATMERPEGSDSLVFRFDDGSSVELQDFYKQYNKDEMPEFEVDGQLIAGADFFEAFGPDLAPAAGPSSSGATRGGRYNEWANASLMDGVNHLDGLDIGFDSEGVESHDEATAGRGDDGGNTSKPTPVDHGVHIIPVGPDVVEGDDGAKIDATNLVVHESGLETGSAPGKTATVAAGQVRIDAPDGVASVTIGGVEFVRNGALVKGAFAETDEGRLTVDGYDAATGIMTYSFTLGKATQEHEKGGATDDAVSRDFTLTVTDRDGDTASAGLKVTINDDAPTITIEPGSFSGAYGEGIKGHVDIQFGADGANDSESLLLSVNGASPVEGVKGDDGVYTFDVSGHAVTLDKDGNFSYDLPANGAQAKYTFAFTVKDADGDTATNTQTVDVVPFLSTSLVSKDDYTLDPQYDGKEVVVDAMPVAVAGIVGQTKVFQTVDGQKVEIGEFSVENGHLFFTQTHAYSHAAGTDVAQLPMQPLQLVGADGITYNVNVGIAIDDSAPKAENDTIHLDKADDDNAYVATGNVMDNDAKGADFDTTVTSVTDVHGNVVAVAGGDAATVVEGRYGNLTIHADGTYSYALNDGISFPETSTLHEVFNYAITDADSDSSASNAAMTFIIGKGLITVRETGYRAVGVTTATGDLAAGGDAVTVESVTLNDTVTYEGLYKDALTQIGETQISGDKFIIKTNYGTLTVQKDGHYTFNLDDAAADPLADGVHIAPAFTMQTITTHADGTVVKGEHTITVDIQGSNDIAKLTEGGKGQHADNRMWIDAKADGQNTQDNVYDAIAHPNIHDGNHKNDLNRSDGGFARADGWLPFDVEEKDYGDSLSFTAVFNKADHNAGANASLEGKPLCSYHDFVSTYNTGDFTLALSKEWQEFTARVGQENLENISFFKNDFGIFAITNTPIAVKGLNHDAPSHWLTFLTDSDSPVVRNMAEGSGPSTNQSSGNGFILQFSFRAIDKTGNVVTIKAGDQTTGKDMQNVMVHVYGSNNAPTLAVADRTLVIADDDVTNYSGKDVENDQVHLVFNGEDADGNGVSFTVDTKVDVGKQDESGTKVFGISSGTLKFGSDVSCQISKGGSTGTKFSLSDFTYKGKALTGEMSVTVNDYRGGTAMYNVVLAGGTVAAYTNACALSIAAGKYGNLYGGEGADTLTGNSGSDNLYGGLGNDFLIGGEGNDRLFGGDGSDTLNGGEGNDILTGGAGDDALDGGAGNDILIGDGAAGIENLVDGTANAETFSDYLRGMSDAKLGGFAEQHDAEGAGNDTLGGGAGDDMLFGGAGDDRLFGGAGDDVLFGGSGDDYLDGGAGADRLYGGAGNDVIAFDGADLIVDGGAGIDFLLSDKSDQTLDELLSGSTVKNVEVLLTGKDAMSLTDISEYGEKYGIRLTDADGDGNAEKMSLAGDKWEAQDDGTYKFTGEVDGGKPDIIMQVNGEALSAAQGDASAEEVAVFTLQNS